MARDKHLEKDEELRLGRLVQNMLQAQERLKSNNITNEEKEHLTDVITAGKQAVDRLVVAYIGLVHSKARAFKAKYPGAPELDDLIQDGMAGLLTAIYHYDPARNNKVSTVASYWIFQSMTRWSNKTGRLVKLPENRVSDFSKISKQRALLELDGITGKEADTIIMNNLGLSQADMYYITNAAATPASLNKVVSSDGSNSYELMDLVARDHTTASSEDEVMQNSMYTALHAHLEKLDAVEKDVVTAAFMLDSNSGTKPLTLKEVRAKHALTPAKFKNVLNRALERIQTELADMGIGYADFVD